MPASHSSIIALDVGEKRIGFALASAEAKIASPLATLPNDDNFTAKIRQIIDDEAVKTIVVGLPRGLEGQDTPQTKYVRQFVEGLQAQLDVPIHLQDEAVTSAKAEEELRGRGKIYSKEDVDALSATYILEDYLHEVTER